MSVGVAIQAPDARAFVEQVALAERLGVPTAWSTIGGAGGADPLTTYAVALERTERIRVGTAIVQTWPKHPIAIAQQALALEQLSPGRLILGVGPAHEPAMVRTYGVRWRRPLTQLREYLTVLRALLHEGRVDFEGEHVTARMELREPPRTPLMASALRPASFALCGELADGAISWMCPRSYLLEQALPALAEGARAAGRAAPPLVAHVPVAVTTDRARARTLARERLGNYSRTPFYLAMFTQAGFGDAAEGYSDALLDDLVVSGTEDEVAEGLRGYLDAGLGEVLAHPVLDPDDTAGSIERAFRAAARAARG
ncbi:MAG: LLM class flavin-dependent oxidoreductase [Dehalococcoidia bacterium]|nr:LLM class flavin-dependent oxidoreductase [Dehalococcoidia bacterium]